jgi:hypothetical protein
VNDTTRSSTISRLLEEISWEGNARRYRNGGRGRENVLTAEVFNALDFLPRTAFLGGVLRAAHGAAEARAAITASIEDADIEVLPGDIAPRLASGSVAAWTVQPDVTIAAATTLCLVEAKRIRPASFQRAQLARTLIGLRHSAEDRATLLLLVLGSAPPLRVARLGRLSIEQAVEVGLSELDQTDVIAVRELAGASVAWITWDEVQSVVHDAQIGIGTLPESVRASVARVASSVTGAIDWHR